MSDIVEKIEKAIQEDIEHQVQNFNITAREVLAGLKKVSYILNDTDMDLINRMSEMYCFADIMLETGGDIKKTLTRIFTMQKVLALIEREKNREQNSD